MENSWIACSKLFCWLQLCGLIKILFSGRSCQVYIIMGCLCMCSQIHVRVHVHIYSSKLTFKQRTNHLCSWHIYCGLRPMTAWAVLPLAVPLYSGAIPCFDNVTFRFCRTIISFMYVSYSSFLTVSQICHFTCSFFFLLIELGKWKIA